MLRWLVHTVHISLLLHLCNTQGQIYFASEENCRTPLDKPGRCISISRCPVLLDLMKNRPTPSNVYNYLRNSVCNETGFLPDICCPESKPDMENVNENFKFSPQGMNGNWGEWGPWSQCLDPCFTRAQKRERSCDSPFPSPGALFCEGSSNQFQNCVGKPCQKLKLPEIDVCGIKANVLANRIVGGVAAELNSWPWFVTLGYDRGLKKLLYSCGGTLITSRHVLTASHCINETEGSVPTYVLLGELELYEDNDGAKPLEIKIKSIFPHERFDSSTFDHDIALILLEKDAPFSDSIRPICLTDNKKLLDKFDDEKLTYVNIAGFGRIFPGGPSSLHLREGVFRPVSLAQCQELNRELVLLGGVNIDENKFCAGGDPERQVDTCQGDSGGPLTTVADLKEGNKTVLPYRNYLVGITSYGRGCAEPGMPSVYTRVSKYIPWIMDNLVITD